MCNGSFLFCLKDASWYFFQAVLETVAKITHEKMKRNDTRGKVWEWISFVAINILLNQIILFILQLDNFFQILKFSTVEQDHSRFKMFFPWKWWFGWDNDLDWQKGWSYDSCFSLMCIGLITQFYVGCFIFNLIISNFPFSLDVRIMCL